MRFNHFNFEKNFLHWLFFLAPLGLLSIARWTNTIFILLILFSIFKIAKTPSYYFFEREKKFWILLVSLLVPFLAEIFVQVARGHIVWSMVDGPSRFLGGALIFILLSRFKSEKIVDYFSMGCVFSIPIVFCVLCYFFYTPYPEYMTKWGGRWALDFMDPLTMSVCLVSLLGVALSNQYPPRLGLFVGPINLLLAVIVVFVILNSAARTAWFCFLVTICFFGVRLFWQRKKQMIIFNCVIVGLVICGYEFVPVIHERTKDLISNAIDFFSGVSSSSSFGIRLGLIELDWFLLKLRPMLGWEDGSLPPFSDISTHVPRISREIYDMKLLAGSHTEYSAQLTRKGLIFGTITIWSIYLYPVFVLARLAAISRSLDKHKLFGIFCFVAVYLVGGLGIQVFNLKMICSLYALVLALAYSRSMTCDQP